MNRKKIMGAFVAMGILTAGMAYAAGCDMCGKDAGCNHDQSVKTYQEATQTLRGEAKAKELALRQEYSFDRISMHRVDELERELKGLKKQLRAEAGKYGVPACCVL